MSVVAVLGGTGAQGKGLAVRLAMAGHEVVLGSRSAERAVEVAGTVNERVGADSRVTGDANAQACGGADIVILAVPYDGHAELVESLRAELTGKVVISCVNPLGFDGKGPYGLAVPDGSAAEEAARIVPEALVVGAFHHVSATSLWKNVGLEHEDVLVCGNDADAKAAAHRTSARAVDRRAHQHQQEVQGQVGNRSHRLGSREPLTPLHSFAYACIQSAFPSRPRARARP